jgi:hypothetical protein
MKEFKISKHDIFGSGGGGELKRDLLYYLIHHYSIELIALSAEYTLFNSCNFNLVYRYYLSVKFNSVYYRVTVTRYCRYLLCVPKDG